MESENESFDRYSYGDIAALLALLLRNLGPDGKNHGSFEEQLAATAKLAHDEFPEGHRFRASIAVAQALHKTNAGLFNDAHGAVAKLLEALLKVVGENGERWSVCGYISQNQLQIIANIP